MTRASRVATSVFLFVAALVVRILSWHSVFQSDGVYPNGNDAYYHLRRIRYSIEHFPRVLDFDPLINFPSGAQPIWPATFDWTIAALLLGWPNILEPEQLERVVVWIPPLLGAGTVVLVFFIGLRFFSVRVALIAGALMAILPAHSIYSRLGALDHHVLVAGVVAVMLGLAMELFREARGKPVEARRMGLSVSLGLSMAAAVLVWPGSLLQVGVLQIAMVVRALTANDREAAKIWAFRFGVAHLAALLALSPMCLGNEWQLWGTLSPVVLSNFQPLYFLAAFACFGLLHLVWRVNSAGHSRSARVVSAGGLGSLVLAGIFLALPNLSTAITDALAWFSKAEEFQSVVNESLPLFYAGRGSAHALAFLSGFVYVVPFCIVLVGWRERRRPDVLLLVGWAAALFAATLVQWRFMNSYSIAHCLLIAITIDAGYGALQSRWTSRPQRSLVAAFAVAIVLLSIVPALRSYRLQFDNVVLSLRGGETTPVGQQLHRRFVVKAARYLRDHSPAQQPAGYSVLGPWGDGHILKYVGERAIVQDNFGDDVAPENFQRAQAYFAARTESEALDVVSPLQTRYVLVRSSGAGQATGYARESLFNRLYRLKGTRGRLPGQDDGRRGPPFDSLSRHRLIYQSEPIDVDATKPYCMIFEIVAGAEVVGRAAPGERVSLNLTIEPRHGRRFIYSASMVTDDEGAYSFHVPYSNRATGPDIQVGDHYTVSAGDRTATLVIPESAILNGGRVVAPHLAR